MDYSEIQSTRDQLQLVKNILATSIASDNLAMNRERVSIAIARVSLVEELLSEVSHELDRVRSENEDLKRAQRLDLAIEREKLQRRDLQKTSKTPEIENFSSRRQIQLSPDQGLIVTYSDLARKYGELL